MYVTSRLLRVSSGAAMPQAVGFVAWLLAHLNDTHHTQFSAGVNVGGDPGVIGVTGRFESLADYQAFIGALAEDAEYRGALGLSGPLFAGAEDTIWRVRLASDDMDPTLGFSAVDSVRIDLAHMVDAVAFAAECREVVTSITGRPSALVTAVTGARDRLLWVGHASSLAELEQARTELEADEKYLELFKRSEGLFREGSLETVIWQRVFPA
ncbi:MAG: hypothetical protein D6683_16355 [Actinomyces sp.]|nr:MAG: hypothetical protein D6683_16355 [Actinomyces sp.]